MMARRSGLHPELLGLGIADWRELALVLDVAVLSEDSIGHVAARACGELPRPAWALATLMDAYAPIELIVLGASGSLGVLAQDVHHVCGDGGVDDLDGQTAADAAAESRLRELDEFRAARGFAGDSGLTDVLLIGIVPVPVPVGVVRWQPASLSSR